MTMKPNISIAETIIRIFVASIWAGIFGSMGSLIGVLAVYPIVTALAAWDPIYEMRGFYTTEYNPYDSHLEASGAERSMTSSDSNDDLHMTA